MKIIISIILTFTLTICFVLALIKPADHYALTATIVEIDRERDAVLCEDFNGNLWEFYGADHAKVGRVVSLLMNGNHTAQVEDDEVLEYLYGKNAD